jgi:hypothetical protein
MGVLDLHGALHLHQDNPERPRSILAFTDVVRSSIHMTAIKCAKCGRPLKGKLPPRWGPITASQMNITCYFCNNPPYEDDTEEQPATKWKDKDD